MASEFVCKIKIVFLLVLTTCCILYGLFWSTFPSRALQHNYELLSDNLSEVRYRAINSNLQNVDSADSTSEEREDIIREDIINNVIRKFMNVSEVRYKTKNLDLRNVGTADSIDELDYFLNIRKLIIFAVHELNQPLKYTNCTKWWANPLDLISHEETLNSTTHVYNLIKFHIQPGNLQLEVTIRQQMPPIEVEDRELEIIGTFKIKDFYGRWCRKEVVRKSVARTCLCYSNENFKEYNQITDNLRKNWNIVDPELKTWRPDKSFYVADYMNFTDYEWFTRSPGKTIQDIATFNYSTEYCGPDIKMLVMVCSAPSHFKHRKIIRETYGSASNLAGKGIKVVFLMGIPTDKKLNDEVNREADIAKDIIQANFEDSYHNVTISHLSMYKWAHLTCINGEISGVTVPKFILKADDDFLLNLDLALEVAQQNSEYEFIGCLFCGGKAVRDVAYMTKYYTPRYMHISNSYAGYLSGVVYLLRSDVIPRVLHMSITTPIICMDDAYVTGLLLRPLQMYGRTSKLFTYGRSEPDPCLSKLMAASYVLNPDDMTAQWDMFVQPIPSNCSLKDLQIKVDELNSGDKKGCFFK